MGWDPFLFLFVHGHFIVLIVFGKDYPFSIELPLSPFPKTSWPHSCGCASRFSALLPSFHSSHPDLITGALLCVSESGPVHLPTFLFFRTVLATFLALPISIAESASSQLCKSWDSIWDHIECTDEMGWNDILTTWSLLIHDHSVSPHLFHISYLLLITSYPKTLWLETTSIRYLIISTGQESANNLLCFAATEATQWRKDSLSQKLLEQWNVHVPKEKVSQFIPQNGL